MKKTKMYLTGILIALGLAISGFGSETIDDNKNTTSIENTVDSAAGTEEFSVTKVPDFDGNAPFVIVNDNKPYFTKKDMSETSFERYSDLDSLGRCGVAFACIGEDIMPKEERGEIGQIKPAGWHTQKYNDIIEGNYVYNRCHLIAFCLAGENANEKNLITGTRYLNVDGMLPFEMRIAGYMDSHRDNHVMYRVTPIYEGDNLVAKGVLLEAYSVEDEGEGVSFCVYAYNVQPGIRIFYDTGETEYTGEFLSEARLAGASTVKEAALTTEATTEVVIETTTDIYVSEETEEITELTVSNEMTYMLNMNTNKFHRISCSGINQMSDRNKWEYTGTRDEIIDMGYNPCKRCNP